MVVFGSRVVQRKSNPIEQENFETNSEVHRSLVKIQTTPRIKLNRLSENALITKN